MHCKMAILGISKTEKECLPDYTCTPGDAHKQADSRLLADLKRHASWDWKAGRLYSNTICSRG